MGAAKISLKALCLVKFIPFFKVNRATQQAPLSTVIENVELTHTQELSLTPVYKTARMK